VTFERLTEPVELAAWLPRFVESRLTAWKTGGAHPDLLTLRAPSVKV
jgi:hypothetical protein